MNAPNFTDLQLMQRVWDVEQVKKLAAKRCYYIANDWREKELSELWVTGEDAKKTASFGRNWGYYIGIPSPQVSFRRPMTEKLPGASGTASPRRRCPPPTPRQTPAGIWKSWPLTS